MEEILFHNSTIVLWSLGLCAVLAAIGATLMARKTLSMSTSSIRRFLEFRFRPTALRYTEEFECLLDGFQENAMILEAYSQQYPVLFSEARWSKLTLTLEHVVRAHQELCSLLERRESKDALCLAEFLIAAGEDLAPWKYHHIADEWAPLATWELDVHTILSTVVTRLGEEARRDRGVRSSRQSSLHETMKVLEKIRKKL